MDFSSIDPNNPATYQSLKYAGSSAAPQTYLGLDGRKYLGTLPNGQYGTPRPGGSTPASGAGASGPGVGTGIGSNLLNPQSGQPQPISNEMSRWAVNQQRAQLAQQYNPRMLQRTQGFNGVTSNSPSTIPALVQILTEGYGQRAAVQPNQVFNDALQNAQWGQSVAQAQSADQLQSAQNLLNLQRINNQQQYGGANILTNLLLGTLR